MSTNQYPGEPPQKSGTSSCLKIGGIGCGVIIVILIGLTVWGVVFVKKNPIFQRAMQQGQLIAGCSQNLDQIGKALNKYAADNNGKYPAMLADLYPKYAANQGMLQCPSSGQTAAVCAYEYTRPAPTAPGDTVVVVCRHHAMVPGQPPTPIKLTKDGRVITEQQVGGTTKPPASTRP